MRRIFVFIFMLPAFSTFLAGCDDSLEFSNTPPGGLQIEKDRCYLGPGDAVVLTGSATDDDGDEISYSWTAEAGTLDPPDGAGPEVTWSAPTGTAAHGTYRVVLRATDGLDTSTKGIDLDVGRSITVLSETITLDQTDYPYIVQGNLPLPIGQLITVTVDAGVTIVFNSATSGLNIAGTFIVNGTPGDRVLFTPNVCPGEDAAWKGLTFTGPDATGTISHASVLYPSSGITVEDGASLTATGLIVNDSGIDGLVVKNGASADITDANIWQNGGGVFVDEGTLLIQDSSIRYNADYGFKIYGTPGSHDVSIQACTVANNNVYGFLLGLQARPVANGCSIFLNGPDTAPVNVEFFPGYSNTEDIDMTGNWWGVYTEPEIQAMIGESTCSVDVTGWLAEQPAD